MTAAALLLMGAWSLQSCKDDNVVLTGQPSWLGNSIYERLSNDPDGQKYTTLLKLVDDLGQKEVLAHTGSKTLFAADDEAFDRWFNTNSWGVRTYDELTNAQKALLLNTAMVNNAYLIELLSNKSATSTTEPTKGGSMRRITAATIYDTVPVIDPMTMPATKAWQRYQQQGKPMRVFKDATARPIIHLLPEFMRVNGFTNEDMDVLTNHKSKTVNVSWINGVEVTEENITCKNGYIHKVADVIEPIDNMAEILRQHPWNMSRWSQLLDRFSAPYLATYTDETEKDRTCLKKFQDQYNTTDSVWAVRYFSNRSMGGAANLKLPDGETEPGGILNFDPGWNQYIYSSNNGDYHCDAGAMLVPRTDVLDAWFEGSAIKDKYPTWDDVPDDILIDLLNNNLLDNFAGTVPSKFSTIVDDAQVTMNVQTSDIDSCFMGCNGMVYLTKKVFTPSSFASVAFPAKINADLFNVINWVIERIASDLVNEGSGSNEFGPYKSILSSMESYYSLLLPTNEAMKTYIDPTLYGYNRGQFYEFYYDTDPTAMKKMLVNANRYELTTNNNTGNMRTESAPSLTTLAVRRNRLEDLLNQLIIVDSLTDGQEYYQTRAGTYVRIQNVDQPGAMTIAGGYQLEGNSPIERQGDLLTNNQPITVTRLYDQVTNTKGNGKSYQMETALPLCATQSVYSLLNGNPNCSEFLKLIEACDMFTESMKATISGKEEKVEPNYNHKNLSLFDGYNYTVYVPSNAVILDLQARGYLPTADDVDAKKEDWGNSDEKATKAEELIKQRIAEFVRYHVQDNSVPIGAKPVTEQNYESAMVNPANYRFFPISVTMDATSMSVRGQYVMDANGDPQPAYTTSGTPIDGRSISIDTASGFYNKMAREFWNYSPTTRTAANKIIYSSSAAVVHLLKDGALFHSASQMSDWKKAVKTELGIE